MEHDTAGLVETDIELDGQRYSVLTEPPGVRMMNFVVEGEWIHDDHTYQQGPGSIGVESIHLIPHPYIHYIFEALPNELYELVFVLFSNGPLEQGLALCYPPLPNVFEDSVCMPDKHSKSRVELIANFWQTQFNYDNETELAAWQILTERSNERDVLSLIRWWEKNLSVEDMTNLPWPSEFEDLKILSGSEW